MTRFRIALFVLAVSVSSLSASQRPDAVTPGRRSTLIVPVAGSAEGAFGTFWRTDLSVINYRDVEQPILIAYSSSGTFFYGFELAVGVVLPAHSTTTYEDVVSTLFQKNGLGVIYINPTSDADPAADLDATYRIWTDQPGKTGTMSQASSALHALELPTGTQTRVIIGARQDANFRCNVGVALNAYGSRSFRITASSASGSVTTTLLVQGDNMAQVALPPGNLGYMTVTVEPLDVADSEVWTAYASSIDNVSGDAWLQNAEPKAK
jgi:hypothetical protein